MGDVYWGDNLGILRDYIADESIDLIYLDPPFNSNRNHNVLFVNDRRQESDVQAEPLENTCHLEDNARGHLRRTAALALKDQTPMAFAARPESLEKAEAWPIRWTNTGARSEPPDELLLADAGEC